MVTVACVALACLLLVRVLPNRETAMPKETLASILADPQGVEPWEPADVDWLKRRRGHLNAVASDEPPGLGNLNAMLAGGSGMGAFKTAISAMPLPLKLPLLALFAYGTYKGGRGLVDDWGQMGRASDARVEGREIDRFLEKKTGLPPK